MFKKLISIFIIMLLFLIVWNCKDDEELFREFKGSDQTMVSPYYNYLKDSKGRYINFRGVNVGTKTPSKETEIEVSHVNRPFSLETADAHFKILRDSGFNIIRLQLAWEGVEPKQKGEYDQLYLDYIAEIVKKAYQNDIYVLMDMHQDLFSRHLKCDYFEPAERTGSIDQILMGLLPINLFGGKKAVVSGDGAPLWVVKACLPEKKWPNDPTKPLKMPKAWGKYKGFAGLNAQKLNGLGVLLDTLGLGTVDFMGNKVKIADFIPLLFKIAPGFFDFDITEATDFLPFTFWGINGVLSHDLNRCFVSFLAGKDVFKGLTYGGQNIQDYLQDAYTNMWVAIAEKVKDYPNVIGYDIINEPVGFYLMLTVVTAYFQLGLDEGVKNLLTTLLGSDKGMILYELVLALNFLPDLSMPVSENDFNTAKPYTKTDYANYSATFAPDPPPISMADWAYIKGYDTYSDLTNAYSPDQAPITQAQWTEARESKYTSYLLYEISPTRLQPLISEVQWNLAKALGFTDYQSYKNPQINIVKRKWGVRWLGEDATYHDVDLFGIIGLLTGIDDKYLRPFYEKVGSAILSVDPDSNIWFEKSQGAELVFGGGAENPSSWEYPMTQPQFTVNGKPVVGQAVYCPHWYPDIYPYIGFNMPPRNFSPEYWKYRDFSARLEEHEARCKYSLGNVPFVMGEFGTYFNFNGIANSEAENYRVSAEILDNYYEGYESLVMSNILWCYSADNTHENGDLWDKEDFSILGPLNGGEPTKDALRGQVAWQRPLARAISGKPVSTHFYSDLHYFEPKQGEPDPKHEFEIQFETKETNAPTEVYVPEFQYPKGFYVFISDGNCVFDYKNQLLYFYPTETSPGFIHKLTIKMPVDGVAYQGWDYFYQGSTVLSNH